MARRPDTPSGGYTYSVIVGTLARLAVRCTIMVFVNLKRQAAPASDEQVGADGGGAGAAVSRTEPASSPNTRAAYGGALRRLTAWLDGRPLDDGNLAAYLDSLREAGRARATAAIVVAAVRRAARHAGRRQPDGPLTRQAMESFRRAVAAAGVSGGGSTARGLTADECDRVLAACCRPRRTAKGVERDEAALRRGLVDGAIVALVFHGALRRGEVAALRWADVDLSAGDDIVVVRVPLPKTNRGEDGDDVRQVVGSCADVQVMTQSSAYRVSRYPRRRISLSNGVNKTLLSKGEATPPCGVPRSVGKRRPSP